MTVSLLLFSFLSSYCSGVCTDNEWKKVFSHDSAFGVFTDVEDLKMKKPYDTTAPLYSFLDKLDALKKKDDWYHLKLCYPELTQYSSPCNEWKQQKNPLETTSKSSFEGISITFNSNGANHPFKGLATNRYGNDKNTIVDASPGSSNWWLAIGAKVLDADNKFPGPVGHPWVTKADIYMKRTFPSPSGCE